MPLLVREHMPESLTRLAGDRVSERVPMAYIQNILACTLASKLVYREGSEWVQAMPSDSLAETAMGYLQAEAKVAELMAQLDESADLDSSAKAQLTQLLEYGGARAQLGCQQRARASARAIARHRSGSGGGGSSAE